MSLANLNLEEIQKLIAANAAMAQSQQRQQNSGRAQGSVTARGGTQNGNTPDPVVSNPPSNAHYLDPQSQSKYQQLLSVIEEMSKDVRPTYAGSKSSAERLKRGIIFARILVRECLVETERASKF
ncbi:unnamed protein product [Lepeophtheirus salmonis]|uniref:(salmon louse) hypothetical protein n=1 Tax=Lepeophtheirus salmonis TaxID=72036 RepID=A0A7R8HCW5_LEPSM|nr:unnamed protein product [Lepeophtheirus salmonis]CAF2999231.1 unnamed protein product [Lepeophtheirus salmonis]